MRPKTIIALVVLALITTAALVALKVAYNRVGDRIEAQQPQPQP